MDEKSLKKVAFYIRVSTEEQAQDDKYGEKNQLEALHALIKSKSSALNFAGNEYVYFDNISGTVEMRNRPAFQRLMEDIILAPDDAKPFEVVAVYKIDRFARKLKVLLEVTDWFENNQLEFISVHESIDTSTPFGKAMLGIIGVISELEIENIKLRTHGGIELAAKEGKYIGRLPPYGYIKDINGRLIILQDEATYVKDIFDLYTKERFTTHRIAQYLTDSKVYSPIASAVLHNKSKVKDTNKKYDLTFWQESTVRRILSQEVYIGNYYFNKTKKIKGKQTDLPKDQWKLSNYHPEKIIEPFQFHQAQEMLLEAKRNNNNYGTNTDHIYLLSGILKCATCYHENIDKGYAQNWIGSRKEIIKGKGKYTYTYTCRRRNLKKSTIKCSSIPIPAKEIEDYIKNFIQKLLTNPTDTFNYYNNRKSSKIQRLEDEKKLREIEKLIQSYPNIKEILREQNVRGLISMQKLEDELLELDKKHQRSLKIKEELSARISSNEISEGYLQIFKDFEENYLHRLEEIFKSREETQRLFRILIKEIIVSSRPTTELDKLAGRRKEGQTIPHKILIKLRLPNEILNDFIREANSKVQTVVTIDSGQIGINGARGQT